MLLFLIVGIIIFDIVKAEDTLYGKCIYLDPGHGGIDTGANNGKYNES